VHRSLARGGVGGDRSEEGDKVERFAGSGGGRWYKRRSGKSGGLGQSGELPQERRSRGVGEVDRQSLGSQ